jgi:hypothetical protein
MRADAWSNGQNHENLRRGCSRQRQPISPELAKEFLISEGILDDSLLLTNFDEPVVENDKNTKPTMEDDAWSQPEPAQLQGDPWSSYFFQSTPLRSSISAPVLNVKQVSSKDGEYRQGQGEVLRQRAGMGPSWDESSIQSARQPDNVWWENEEPFPRPFSQMISNADFTAR